MAAGNPQPIPPPLSPKKLSRVVARDEVPEASAGGDRLVHDHRARRQRLGYGPDRGQGRHRRPLRLGAGPGPELVQMARLVRPDCLDPLSRLPALGGGHPALERREEIGQRRLRISENGDRGRIVLPELPGVRVEVDHVKARRHGIDVGRERERQEVAAHREQHVGLRQDLAHRGRDPCEGSAEQRVGRGERRGVRDTLGIHRRAEGFCDGDELGVSVALGDGVAGQDQRAGRPRQHVGGRLHRRAVPTDSRRDARRRAQLDDTLGLENVRGQGQEDRPGGRGQRGLRRAVDEARQVFETPDLGRPLHERPRDRRQVRPQNGLGDVERLIVLPCGHQKGRSRLLGVVEHAERVAETGRHVDAHDAELAGGLGIPVGDRDHRGLLERQHVGERGLLGETVHQRQLGRPRVPEHVPHALLLQDVQEGALARRERHGGPPDRG